MKRECHKKIHSQQDSQCYNYMMALNKSSFHDRQTDTSWESLQKQFHASFICKF